MYYDARMSLSMDSTQWLPKGIAIITPERQLQLGIHVEYDTDGLVKYARTTCKQNILQFLHAQHILDDLEYDNGRDYQQWREMFRAFCSSQRMTANYGEVRISGQSGHGVREQAYSKLLRHLPNAHQKYIEYTLDTIITPSIEKQAKRNQEIFQRVFNRLGAVMEMIRKELDNRIEN